MQETAVEGEEEELGVELMDTESAHLSLVLEESQVKSKLLGLNMSFEVGFIHVFFFRVRWSLLFWHQRCPSLN